MRFLVVMLFLLPLAACARISSLVDSGLEPVGDIIVDYCKGTSLEQQIANRVRLDKATFPHTVRVNCARPGDEVKELF